MASRKTGTLGAGEAKSVQAVPHEQTEANHEPTFVPIGSHRHSYTSAAQMKRSGEPKAFHSPEQDPKPKPIKDPWGYRTSITATALAVNEKRCSAEYDREYDHNKLKEAFGSFGVDLSQPVFARMLQNFEGLTPMQRFLKEDR